MFILKKKKYYLVLEVSKMTIYFELVRIGIKSHIKWYCLTLNLILQFFFLNVHQPTRSIGQSALFKS
jgi:hypothetical protein